MLIVDLVVTSRWRGDIIVQEQYGQGWQRTEEVGGLWRRAASYSGRTQPRIE